jgi:hypothetical protein
MVHDPCNRVVRTAFHTSARGNFVKSAIKLPITIKIIPIKK